MLGRTHEPETMDRHRVSACAFRKQGRTLVPLRLPLLRLHREKSRSPQSCLHKAACIPTTNHSDRKEADPSTDIRGATGEGPEPYKSRRYLNHTLRRRLTHARRYLARDEHAVNIVFFNEMPFYASRPPPPPHTASQLPPPPPFTRGVGGIEGSLQRTRTVDSLDAGERVHEAHVEEGVDVHRRVIGPPGGLEVEVRSPQELVSVDKVRRRRSQQSYHHAVERQEGGGGGGGRVEQMGRGGGRSRLRNVRRGQLTSAGTWCKHSYICANNMGYGSRRRYL